MAYTLIETGTVGSGGASSIEFTSIPQEAGADLVVLLTARGGNELSEITFNSDTGTNYNYATLRGTGSVADSNGSAATEAIRFYGITETSRTANVFGNAKITISNYTSSSQKSVSIDGVTENNATYGVSGLTFGYYTSTNAITSLKLASNGSTLAEHTTASLYLVTTADATGASNPSPSATGGSISVSGGYWYHTFTASGTFTPTTSLACEYVVVGGGGGGWTGGGGGGNVITGSDTMNTAGKTVTIGSGGAGGRGASGAGCGGDDYYPFATNGNQSSLVTTNNGTITGGGGGFGGGKGTTYTAGSTGGSGGGGFYTNAGDYAGSSGNGTNANAGGTGKRYSGNNYALGGGGGGAGGAGGTPANGTTSGNGGAAYNWNGFLLGGGGGASGSIVSNMTNTGGTGASGGGNGATFQKNNDEAFVTVTATSGAAGTGSGGGGSPYGSSRNSFYPNDCGLLTGGAGGSGVVIIRYAA